MADVIQFCCPVCGAMLRLPLSMASQQGPCPCCHREIVAPDPARNLGAYEETPPPRSKLVEPTFRPFIDPSQAVPITPAPHPISNETAKPKPEISIQPTILPRDLPSAKPAHACSGCGYGSPQRTILVLSVLLTAMLSLVAGYVIGIHSNWLISQSPQTLMIPPKLEKPEVPAEPPTKTVIVAPKIPEPDQQPAPVKASAAAQAAVQAFLDAPDWTTRSAYVLNPDKVKEAMEKYSHEFPDGPTPFKSISLQNSYTDKESGNTLFIFQVITEKHPTGIPIAVAETTSGWQVDWQTFIEFRDDQFKSFADGPADQSGKFHLMVSQPPPPRASKTENEHFVSFLIDPPLPDRQRLAYVKKPSEIQATLSAATASGAIFYPVLELAKRTTPDGKTYLEITAIRDNDWLPADR